MRSLSEIWDGQAAEWARWVRTPGHDRVNELLNVPTLVSLLPPPPRGALDLGCGEGRFARRLLRRGDDVVAVDASPAMVALAGEDVQAVLADAAALPFEDGAFGLVTAFMSLQDMDDTAGAVDEAARVLHPGGHLCFCIPHPVQSAGAFAERHAAARFVVEDYRSERRLDVQEERDGIAILFAKIHRPLEAYSRMLEAAGLAIEALRETGFPQELWRDEASSRWTRVPTFLHVRAVKR